MKQDFFLKFKGNIDEKQLQKLLEKRQAIGNKKHGENEKEIEYGKRRRNE